MWEGRSDYFPAEGRQPGSGSKKPGSAIKPPRLTPSGGSGGGGMRIALGGGAHGGGSGEAPLGSSYGAEWGGGGGGGNGSYGSSYSRRPGSFIERFAREREAGGSVGPGSFGAAGSSGRPDMLGSAGKGARGSQDAFARITPQRWALGLACWGKHGGVHWLRLPRVFVLGSAAWLPCLDITLLPPKHTNALSAALLLAGWRA